MKYIPLTIFFMGLISCSSPDAEEMLLTKVNLFFDAWNRHDFQSPEYKDFLNDTVVVWHNQKNGKGIRTVFDANSGWRQWDIAWSGRYSFDSIVIDPGKRTIRGTFHEMTDFLLQIGDSSGYKATVTYWLDSNYRVKEILYQWSDENKSIVDVLQPIVTWALKFDSSLIKDVYLENGFTPSSGNARKWKDLLERYESANTTAYYRCIAYNLFPFWTINGVYPIRKNEVKIAPYYYKFEFGSNGRIQRISFYKKNKLFNGVSQHYGNLGANTLLISYPNNKEVREYYDVFGNPVKGRWQNFREVYTLDEYGRKVSLEFKDEENETTGSYHGISLYKWEWLSDSTVIENRFSKSGEQKHSDPEWLFETVEYSINRRGQYLKISNLSFSENNLIDNPNGIARIVFHYNDHDQEVGADFFDSDGMNVPIGEIGIARTRGMFDSLGRYVLEQYFDTSGNLTTVKPYSFAQRKMDYQKFDNRVMISYLDTKGNFVDPFDGGYFFEQEIYNSDGYPAIKQFLDLDSSLSNNSFTQVAKTVYKYDSLNRILEVAYFDQDTKPAINIEMNASKIRYVYDKSNVNNFPTDTIIWRASNF